MQNEHKIQHAKFTLGERVRHHMLEYRGIVMDVDPFFAFTDEVYKTVVEHGEVDESNEPRSKPWYQVLVHNTSQMTYVSEQNLLRDFSEEEFEHPALEMLFTCDEQGQYQRRLRVQ
jgi:heat shock protein HspQ